jgi:hypothetical protein
LNILVESFGLNEEKVTCAREIHGDILQDLYRVKGKQIVIGMRERERERERERR